MLRSIEIIRVQDDLNEQRWYFYIFDSGKVVLDGFYQSSRPSKRHNFRSILKYERKHESLCTMSLEEVPWDDDLVREVKEKILSMITVVKTHSRK
jgi:hypothetical protein